MSFTTYQTHLWLYNTSYYTQHHNQLDTITISNTTTIYTVHIYDIICYRPHVPTNLSFQPVMLLFVPVLFTSCLCFQPVNNQLDPSSKFSVRFTATRGLHEEAVLKRRSREVDWLVGYCTWLGVVVLLLNCLRFWMFGYLVAGTGFPALRNILLIWWRYSDRRSPFSISQPWSDNSVVVFFPLAGAIGCKAFHVQCSSQPFHDVTLGLW